METTARSGRAPRGGRTALVGGVSLALGMVMLVACSPSGGSGGSGPRPTGSAPEHPSIRPSAVATSTGSAGRAARSAATAAYLGMWRDMAQAATAPDWKSPRLADHASGDALSTVSRGMYADHVNGLVMKGAPKNAPKVTPAIPSTASTTVLISDCGDSSHWLKYRAGSGKLADSDPGGRQSITAEVKRQSDGTGKVDRKGPCPAPMRRRPTVTTAVVPWL